jgi:hypothetical protein
VRDQYDQVRELLQLTSQKHERNLLRP